MEYVKLGASSLKVSPLCLGTMMFGDRTDAAEAGRIVASAREAGVNRAYLHRLLRRHGLR